MTNALRFDDLWERQIAYLAGIDRLDLLILRHHALLEVALQDLLAVRLMVSPHDLCELTFAKLAQLALAGMSNELKQAILQLNTLRNYAAHDLTAGELEHRVSLYLTANPAFDAPWPEQPENRLLVVKAALVVVSHAVSSAAAAIARFCEDERGRHETDPDWVDERRLLAFISNVTRPVLSIDQTLRRHNVV